MKDTGNKKDRNQHIKVLVSVRPFNGAGRASKSPVVVDVESNKEIVVCERPQDKLTKNSLLTEYLDQVQNSSMFTILLLVLFWKRSWQTTTVSSLPIARQVLVKTPQ
ncbi:hypothetical protein QAD02_006296 [Eretmocerus hayati]|uniref:Uncharacterized protein n=1 Tax=Eretmocerus hayati TaxID=131215 RepID=A0ACC2N0V1_9HYME|nr:hypothetical protein QAD02_006296 [Eretmocerus hayati]